MLFHGYRLQRSKLTTISRNITRSGMRAIQLGLYDEATAAFQQVLTLNPQNAEAHCELGAVYTLKEKDRRGFGSISSRLGIAGIATDTRRCSRLSDANLRCARSVRSG